MRMEGKLFSIREPGYDSVIMYNGQMERDGELHCKRRLFRINDQ